MVEILVKTDRSRVHALVCDAGSDCDNYGDVLFTKDVVRLTTNSEFIRTKKNGRDEPGHCNTWKLLSALRRSAQVLPADRQGAQSLASRREDRIGHRGLDHGRRGLADAAPFSAGGGREIYLGLGRLFEAHDRIG